MLGLDADATASRAALQIEASPAAGSGEAGFYCMEPFKTMYVTRNGPVKPCCFADADWFLGDASKNDALDIWDGPGFRAVREGIAKGEYPSSAAAA